MVLKSEAWGVCVLFYIAAKQPLLQFLEVRVLPVSSFPRNRTISCVVLEDKVQCWN